MAFSIFAKRKTADSTYRQVVHYTPLKHDVYVVTSVLQYTHCATQIWLPFGYIAVPCLVVITYAICNPTFISLCNILNIFISICSQKCICKWFFSVEHDISQRRSDCWNQICNHMTPKITLSLTLNILHMQYVIQLLSPFVLSLILFIFICNIIMHM